MTQLKEILEAYRNKQREFPSYGELMALATAPVSTIDCREFHELAMDYRAAAPFVQAGKAYQTLVSYIDAQAGQVAVPGWISVDECLPDGKYCLATYQDRAGKLRIIRAMYVRQFEIEADGDECDGETNEENDRDYLKAGWYELIDNWGEYSSVHVSEGPVTHWMPLPAAPAAEKAV
jgi:hypothetical protein